MIAKHRRKRLMFEAVFIGIAPRQDSAVGNVDEAHGSPRVRLAGRAHRLPFAIGKGKLLLMASGAGLRAIA